MLAFDSSTNDLHNFDGQQRMRGETLITQANQMNRKKKDNYHNLELHIKHTLLIEKKMKILTRCRFLIRILAKHMLLLQN